MGCCGKKTKAVSSSQRKKKLYNEAINSGLPVSLAIIFAGYSEAEVEALNL